MILNTNDIKHKFNQTQMLSNTSVIKTNVIKHKCYKHKSNQTQM